MPTHDAYARLTPFELAFPDREFVEERFRRIRDEGEGESAGEPLRDPGRFLSLVSVSETLARIRPPGESSEEIHRHGVLLYHAFHFHEAGEPLYLLTTRAARYLVEAMGAPGEAAEPGPEPPAPAGYLQLPRYLFWTRPTDEDTPEPVDGVFWSAPGGGLLSALLACGVRGDRPGLSVVPLPPVPLSDAPAWLDARIRPEGEDFESTLPGGELERLYSVETAGEVLKLFARFFRHVTRVPRAVTDQAAPEKRDDDPPPTALPYRRVGLAAESGAGGEGNAGASDESTNRETHG